MFVHLLSNVCDGGEKYIRSKIQSNSERLMSYVKKK